MGHRQNPIHESSGLAWHIFRLVSGVIRFRPLILLAGAAVISYGIYNHFKEQAAAPHTPAEIRMPITNAPLEPDRPVLIGEPRIDE